MTPTPLEDRGAAHEALSRLHGDAADIERVSWYIGFLEGQVMGYELLHGKQQPRCHDCATAVPAEFQSKKYGVTLCRSCWQLRETVPPEVTHGKK